MTKNLFNDDSEKKNKQKSDKANLIIRNRKWNDSTIFELNHKKFEKNDNVSLILKKNLIDSIEIRELRK
jgi:hypothetical protein